MLRPCNCYATFGVQKSVSLDIKTLSSYNLPKIELSPEECVNPAHKSFKFEPFG